MSSTSICLPTVTPGSEIATCFPDFDSETFSFSDCMLFTFVSSFPSLHNGIPVFRVPFKTSTPTTAGFDCLNMQSLSILILHGFVMLSSSFQSFFLFFLPFFQFINYSVNYITCNYFYFLAGF